MDVDPIAPANAVDRLTALLAVREALEAISAPTAESAPAPLERALNPNEPTAAQQPATLEATEALIPGADSDFSHEAATVQTAWRAPTPPAETPHADDASLPTTPADQTGFTVPDALLVPTLLTGLHIEPGAGWAHLSARSPWTVPPPAERRREPREQRREERHDPPEHETPEPPPHEPRHDEHAKAPDAVLDADTSDWCEALTRALRWALAARVVPQALLAAAEQWKRGRCVVVACPQRDGDPGGPAWAFVLWPRAQLQAADGRAPELALRGLRVDARLQWSTPPRPGAWCHVRVVKEHHPRSGRQLVSLRDGASLQQAVACEVQLGPVLARSLRACDVCMRVPSAQRFWAALGTQWSMHVVVCAHPLLAPPLVVGA